MYQTLLKRLIDVILSFVGLVLLAPLFLVLIIVIKVDSRGPAFFKQERVGKNKTSFIILKLRTMKTDTPKEIPTHLLDIPEQYITKTGKFLRRFSLDELPQLWNIIVSNMSIVGPRPALLSQHDLIEERDKYGVNDVRPGLTGWAQVNGRDKLPIAVKAKFDAEYVRNMSFAFDCKCFFMTLLKVINSEGVVEGGANHDVGVSDEYGFSEDNDDV